ncbi:orotate phosphoribosyltransferase [Ferrimicrobium sp.]|uniref:orotate phosphoribosyltransferase n=1 Tax=Ferrimicrobium sp. TaxID=2926050 RepID=UPI00262FDE17|nr:orotate phosphoribosyltransferase [Ferrimicrobium sp.]
MELTPADAAAARAELIASIKEYAITYGDFTLKSGARSTWFIDTKRAICRPPTLFRTAQLTLAALADDVTTVGGLTMGADPIAFATAAIAQANGRNLGAFSVRKEPKEYGQGGRIVGNLTEHDRVCVVEDTPSRGTSLKAAIEAVEATGAKVVQALAIVDRGGSASQVVAPIPFVALITAPDLGLPYEGGLEHP